MAKKYTAPVVLGWTLRVRETVLKEVEVDAPSAAAAKALYETGMASITRETVIDVVDWEVESVK